MSHALESAVSREIRMPGLVNTDGAGLAVIRDKGPDRGWENPGIFRHKRAAVGDGCSGDCGIREL